MVDAAELERGWHEGRARWSGVSVDREAFAAYAIPRVPTAADALPHAVDLYLACGCAQGDAAALRAFDREYLRTLGAMLSRLAPPAAIVDEVEQLLRERLLVRTPEREPAITRYAGRGSLAGWLKVVAIREAMALLEKRGRDEPPDELAVLMASAHDPELDLMRERYRDAFRDAFAAALAGLDQRERELLRCHLVERIGIDAIGRRYGVHRATAARWLAALRERLFTATREALTERLAIDTAEYDSILRLVRSQLDMSLGE